jgi:hypothetical protein
MVDELVNGEMVNGEHKIIWNAEGLASGVYFVKLMNGQFQTTQKLILLK